MKMEFCDLKRQYAHLKEKIDSRISKVMEHGKFINGPEIKELEDKLANFVGRGVIAADTVCALVLPRADADIFATIGALTAQQSTALFALERQLTKGDDPFYILSMYAYHVRVLLMVSDCVRRGHVSSQEIAKRTNLHPFVVQKSLAALRTFPYERLVALSRRLADLDHHAKTGRVRDLPTALAVFTATA